MIVLQTLPGTPRRRRDSRRATRSWRSTATSSASSTPISFRNCWSSRGSARRGWTCGVPDSELLHFTLTPEEMQSPSVDRAFFMGAGIGYIRVTSFDEKTAQQMKAAIEKLGGDVWPGWSSICATTPAEC